MGNLKRITLLLLIIVFATNVFSTITVEAAVKKPTETWDLTNDGQYKFSGSASGSMLYTNYKFTNASKVRIYVNNTHKTKDLEVKIVKDSGWFPTPKKVVVPANGRTTFDLSLNKTDKYFISFKAPSNFSGHIKKQWV